MNAFKLAVNFAFIAQLLVGCAGATGTSPKGLVVPLEKVAAKLSYEVQAGGYQVIDTDELKNWLEDGRPVTIISTLPPADEMLYGIIPGSLNAVMPKNELDIAPEDKEHLWMAAGSDKKRILVIYSSSLADRRSHVGAKLLVDYGYKNVYRYPAGITKWIDAVTSSAR